MKYRQIPGLFVVLLLGGCVWVSSSQVVPHANFKLVIENADNEQNAIDIAEEAILSLGYKKQPNDWKDWTFLEPEALDRKKLERRYKRGRFRISYSPDLDATYRSLGTPHLHFYEYDQYVFSEAGVAEYNAIHAALENAGLSLGETLEPDIKHAREVRTPADFNSRYNPPSTAKRASSALYAFGAFGVYSLVVLLPGYRAFLKISNSRKVSRTIRVALFTAAGAGLLAPAPMPLSMFGPMLLVPMPLLCPMLASMPTDYYIFVVISVGVTAIISFLVALRFVKKGA